MLKRLRAVMTTIWTPLADLLIRLGVSPDAVTISGTVAVVVAALWLYPTGHLLAGSLVITVFVLADSLDGVMARRSGRTGSWGAFLDSTLDRFADGAIFAGLVLWYTGGGSDRTTGVLALICLVIGSIVPYARARAEGLGMTAAVGIAERADRLVVVLTATALVGMGLPRAVLTVALGLLAVAGLITVFQRMQTVRAQVAAATRAPGQAEA
ncbi:CDP-diacylglycerol--inositol 3-phosphatidyltransferase [mine drainage metagenome]|uniref:Phosphatidylinositol phosphate synthase n=1 Tax=mine drainage metagenome TaxID=410659 RepID=A0A1J5QPB9_9ZZZZ